LLLLLLLAAVEWNEENWNVGRRANNNKFELLNQ